jgi:hypothetical protein
MTSSLGPGARIEAFTRPTSQLNSLQQQREGEAGHSYMRLARTGRVITRPASRLDSLQKPHPSQARREMHLAGHDEYRPVTVGPPYRRPHAIPCDTSLDDLVLHPIDPGLTSQRAP